jgi:predicted permease
VLLRPLPYQDPDRLVMVWEKRLREGVLDNVVSPADYLDWATLQTAFEAMAAQTVVTADLTGRGDPVRLIVGAVSPPFFDILRVRIMVGRPFRAEEATVGKHRVVILAHAIWQARFGGDRNIVGTFVTLNGNPAEIVGVLPPDFEFPDSAIEVWAPLPLMGTPQPPTRTSHYLNVYARLKPGVTLEAARADMDRVGALLQQQYPEANRNHSAHVIPLREQLSEPVQGGLLLLFGAVAFVLLIACVNVANLLLTKAAARRREMAVRAALGAGRARLVGQALTESVVLGLAGGAAGLLVARWGIDLIRALAPSQLPVLGVGRLGLDPRVLTFTLILSIGTGVLFGLLPAWHLARQNVNDSLKDGGRSPAGVRRRLRVALVVSEIALASLLLVGAGLTLRSFQSLLRSESGFDAKGKLTVFVALPASRYRDDQRVNATFDEIERRFAAIPGARAVAAAGLLPLSGDDSRTGVAIEGREPTPDAPTRAHPRPVTTNYFRTMGIRLIAGRHFTDADHPESPFVIIVNQTMATRYWPNASPIGKRVRMGGSQAWREVVGVVADVKHWGLDGRVNPEMYLPQRQMVFRSLYFVLATDGDPAALAAPVREQLRAIDPDLPLSKIRTLEDVAARSVASQRAAMILLGIFGSLALTLAAAGIYGVMAHLVALRTAEIGVRMTLGARPGDVMRLVIREGTLQAVAGLAVGLTGAVLLMRSFRAMLFGVSPADPVTLAAVAAILMATALLACLIPARRAMRVDPVEALRN